ncbi:MAG: YqgE/AlgH family protein [Chlamydiales bacterium]
MDSPPYANLAKGTLLIASPELDAGVYFRAVLLLCEHSPAGSFALMINKPLDGELPEDILNLKQMANPRVQINNGGPMQPNQMMLLHSSNKIPDQTLAVCPGVYLGGDLQFLQEAVSDPEGPFVRLCFGYAGWGPGNLEREFMSGAWFLHPATARLVFETQDHKMWQTVLREMGGKYATMSMIPEDLSLN